jgi:alkylated DNA repair protein (DNA oxidative demethylase)
VQNDLFRTLKDTPSREDIAEGAVMLRGFALANEDALLNDIQRGIDAAPFRNMVTPGGFTMSVAMTNCGTAGWVSDRRGYRFDALDPISSKPWPAMPESFLELAQSAAAEAGYAHFMPDACLVNRYVPGTRLTLHQDRNEKDVTQPIVSVSLGLPAVFQFGGLKRADRTKRYPLFHGDVVVWGGPSRMNFHGVLPLKEGTHPKLGASRINLTFRKAL